ncbi:MAG: SRPBCC family protein [Ferruginibacter sp.]
MQQIHLTTFISAPIERVFDLSRSIDLHKISASDTKEEAVAGIITGLINLNETVTWKAKHLFKIRFFTSLITAMEKPVYFCDEMQKGDFKSLRHEHHFKKVENGTIMIDILEFETPYKKAGRIFNKLYLTKYLSSFISKRNKRIKEYAESQKWKLILQ